MISLRTIGIVERWDQVRQFGFIRTPREAFFVHVTMVVSGQALAPGEIVEFVPAASPRGPRATWVRRIPPACPKCDAVLQGLECRACGFRFGA